MRTYYAALVAPPNKQAGWLCNEEGLIILAETADYMAMVCKTVIQFDYTATLHEVKAAFQVPPKPYLAFDVEMV